MASSTPKRSARVAGRLVVHVRGRNTQTVRIHHAETGGGVEACYRLPIGAEVSTTTLREEKFHDVDSLREWLVARGGVPEDPNPAAGGAIEPLLRPSAEELDWAASVAPLVEKSITALVDGFVADPYLHRVEHSVHAELFTLLKSHDELRGTATLSSGERTQLVHKEWPETVPRPWKGGGRGSFDLAVLPPAQLGRASLRQFRDGRVEAPIVIELGLDYGKSHLSGDVDKFSNSSVHYGYLVHLSRAAAAGNADVERIVESTDPRFRVAYAHVDGLGAPRVKHLGEPRVSPSE